MAARTTRGLLTLALSGGLLAGLPAGTALATPEASTVPAVAERKPCRKTCSYTAGKGDKIKVDPRLGLRRLKVAAVGDGWVDLRVRGTAEGLDMEGRNISASGSCTPDGCVNSGALTVTTDSPGRVNRLAIRLVDTRGGKAHLALRTLR